MAGTKPASIKHDRYGKDDTILIYLLYILEIMAEKKVLASHTEKKTSNKHLSAVLNCSHSHHYRTPGK